MDAKQDIPKLPILIFGGGCVTGVSVARIFTEAGFHTYNIDNGSELSSYSRRYRPLRNAKIAAEPAQLAGFLAAVNFPRAFLIACSDNWMSAVATLPQNLRARFLTCSSPPHAIETFLNKWSFAQLLTRISIPRPHTKLLASMEDLEQLEPCEFSTAFLKPLNSLDFTKVHGVKGLFFSSKSAAIQHARKFGFPVMLQEFISGPATAHYFIDGFVDRHGKTRAGFTRQRIRMYSRLFGNSTCTASVPPERVLPAIESLDVIFGHLKYRGIFNAEFKFDERDGQFKLLEINARPWIYVEFAARAGVNVCLMAYRDALGLPIEDVRDFMVGKQCVDVLQDVRAFRSLSKGEREGVWPWLKSLFQAEKIAFRWMDPGVAIAAVMQVARRRFVNQVRLWAGKKGTRSRTVPLQVQPPTGSDVRWRKVS
jgi:predicted ATP-grasp superfamily ATP-dependent carboligase